MEQANETVKIESWNDIGVLVLMSIGTDKGSWWADPDFGSEIYLLKEYGKVDGRTAGTLKRMLQECLAWIVADGLAKSITCSTERSGKNEITYTIQVAKPNGNDLFIKETWHGI